VLSAAEQIGAGSAPAAAVIEHVQQLLVDVLDVDAVRFQEATSELLPPLELDGEVILGEHKMTSIVKVCPLIPSCAWRFVMPVSRTVSFG
jgi:hypothetical protein